MVRRHARHPERDGVAKEDLRVRLADDGADPVSPDRLRRVFTRGAAPEVGESYSEIFFGNSVALGMPCVTADHASLAALMQLVEEDPAVQLVVDLEGMRASAGEKHFKIALPSAARESFLEGTWDATGLLLDRFEEVEAVARRLPYVSGTWS